MIHFFDLGDPLAGHPTYARVGPLQARLPARYPDTFGGVWTLAATASTFHTPIAHRVVPAGYVFHRT